MQGEQSVVESGPVNDVPSFVDLNVNPVNFFAVEPIGDDMADHAMGVRLAEEAMAYARKHNNSLVIAFALGRIASAREQLTAVDCAFIFRIAAAAAAGSMN